jgi:hypothetical protein
MTIRAKYETKIQDAEAALRAWDAEHPEVVAEIKRERAELAERNQWM